MGQEFLLSTESLIRSPQLNVSLAAYKSESALANAAVDVALIDRHNHHTFQPLLYQVVLAVLTSTDMASPIRTVLRHARNVKVLIFLLNEEAGYEHFFSLSAKMLAR